jgi:protein gp37
MGQDSAIEWTHHTFNPWWGCTKISPGCANCYAEAFDKRVGGEHWGPGVERRTFGDKHWNEPKKWNAAAAKAGERHRVFCASMADVFEAEAPAGQLERLWALIRETPHLDWLLLTKRPERIAQSLPADWGKGYANVWLGTSVEDQARADERIPHLVRVPAVVWFLSMEPLLGPVDLGAVDVLWAGVPLSDGTRWSGSKGVITWVIVGGESGPKARPMHPAWARSIRDQCAAAGVAFFFKQHGEWRMRGLGDRDDQPRFRMSSVTGKDAHLLENSGGEEVWMQRVGKAAAGRELDGRTWDEVPRR